MKADLKVRLRRLFLANPVIAASGTFGYGDEYSEYINVSRLGGVITKTITLQPRPGNKPCRIAETACGMLNSIGLENIGLKAFIEEKAPKLKHVETRVIASIAGNSPEEFARLAKELSCVELVHALELNLSCPNIHDENKVYGSSGDVVGRTVEAVRSAQSLPVIAKLSPNVSDVLETAEAADMAGADAVCLVNTFIGMAVDIKTRKPRISTVTAGYSGPAVKPLALRYVWMAAKKLRIPIIASGGIMNTDDAVEFLITGASAVAVGTANFINPKAGEEIAAGIEKYLKANRMKDIGELTGSIVC